MRPERMTDQAVADRQEIEQLRRLYAKATDLIGRNDSESVEQGREIYHRIFTPDVNIRTSGAQPLTAEDPDAWVSVVLRALKDYEGTQHLIGSQLVDLHGREGTMESYVNAWHQNTDGSTFVFIGTYHDKVRLTESGWQIYDMTLTQQAGGMIQVEAR